MTVGAANPMGQVIALVAGTTSSMSWSTGPVAKAGNGGWDLGDTCFNGFYLKKIGYTKHLKMFSNMETYYIKTNGTSILPLWYNLMKCAAMIDELSLSHELTIFSPSFTILYVQVMVRVVQLCS